MYIVLCILTISESITWHHISLNINVHFEKALKSSITISSKITAFHTGDFTARENNSLFFESVFMGCRKSLKHQLAVCNLNTSGSLNSHNVLIVKPQISFVSLLNSLI